MLQTITQTVPVATPLKFRGGFKFFTLVKAANPVTIKYGRGTLDSAISGLLAGVKFRAPAGQADYDVLEITTTVEEEISFVLGDSDVDYNRAFGTVTVEAHPNGSSHTGATKTAGNASSVMLAANSSRKYLLVQNQSETEDAYINTDGGAAAADGTSLKLAPGDVYEPLVPPTNAINMIRGGATDVTLHVIEA